MSYEVAGKGYVFTKKQSNDFHWCHFHLHLSHKAAKSMDQQFHAVSSASQVVIHSQLSACQRKVVPLDGHPSTRGHQTGLRKRPE